MRERKEFFAAYWEWCCRLQDDEAASGFKTLSWVGDIQVQTFFAFSEENPAVAKRDLLRALLADRLRRVYGVEASVAASVAAIDPDSFSSFRRSYLDRLFMDVTFSRLLARRMQNRKRDRKVAKSIQETLAERGWKAFRETPSELGATSSFSGVDLRLWLALPHGSLQFELDLDVDGERWMRRESYLAWMGFGGSTEVWSTTDDPTGLADFVVEQALSFRTLIEQELA
jgi:hypothetical protein